MNPMNRQHTIREYELFVSSGVQVIPAGVFEIDTRTSTEYREVRAHPHLVLPSADSYAGIELGQTTIDLRTGEIIEDEG